MKRYLIFLGFVIVLFYSCGPEIKIVNVKNANEYYPNSVYYVLPETVLKVKATLLRTTYRNGPYSDYTERFIGINEYIKKNEVKWEILSAKIDANPEPDYNHFYAISTKNKAAIKSIQTSSEGFLIGINSSKLENTNNVIQDNYIIKNKPEISFPDLSIKKFYFDEEEKGSKKAKRDSSDLKTHNNKTTPEFKTLEQKAKEAADFIVRLRKRAFKLMAGLYPNHPDGIAVENMINELKEKEKQYVGLFVGESISDTVYVTFEYTPDKSKEINTYVCAYFSESKGLSNESFQGAVPITLKVFKTGKTNVIESYQAKISEKESLDGLYYRIPDLAVVQIFAGNGIVASKKIAIAQFGVINTIPLRAIVKDKASLQFDHETGNINSIITD
jgi:hypothetical protein